MSFANHFQQITIMKDAVNSMRRSKQRMCLNQWGEVSAGVKEKNAKIGGVLKSLDLATRQMRQAYNTLTGSGRNYRRIKNAAYAILSSSMVKALNSWRDMAVTKGEQLAALSRGGAIMRYVGLRRAFNSFLDESEAAAKNKQRLQTSLAALRGDDLRKAWFTLKHLFVLYRRMLVVANKLASGKAALAYRTWKMTAKELSTRHWRERGAILVFDAQWRSVRHSINVWRERRGNLRRLVGGIMRYFLRRVRRAFQLWIEGAHDQIMDDARRPAMLNRAVSALRNKGKFLCFCSWKNKVARRAERRRRLAAGVKDLLHGGGYRKAWYAWRELVDERHKLISMLAALRNQGLFKAWSTWAELAAEYARRARRLTATSKDLLSGGGYRKAWFKWSSATEGIRKARGAIRSLISSRVLSAMNSWKECHNTRRNLALRMLEETRRASHWSGKRGLEHAWFLWRNAQLRKRLEHLVPVRTPLWLQPAFDRWSHRLRLRKGVAFVWLGCGHAFARWVEGAADSAARHGVRHQRRLLRRGDRTVVCHRGQWMMKELRHSGLRGLGGIWRHSLLSGRPRFSRAWVLWKADATRHAVARKANVRRVRRELSRALVSLRDIAFIERVRARIEATQQGGRGRLRMCQVELMSAEAHGTLLSKALEAAHAKNRSTLRNLEQERDAALQAEQRARAEQQAERAAAVAALARRNTVRAKSPKPVQRAISVDRWSTAASRGQAKITPESFNEAIARQRLWATSASPPVMPKYLRAALPTPEALSTIKAPRDATRTPERSPEVPPKRTLVYYEQQPSKTSAVSPTAMVPEAPRVYFGQARGQVLTQPEGEPQRPSSRMSSASDVELD